jgi:hypothetical protein
MNLLSSNTKRCRLPAKGKQQNATARALTLRQTAWA